ncbi:hypothetical protein BCR44DRAFT_49159 [Catenaria anguillulae PL171]|uniref:TRAF-type domain-containing protein n=1 Tax=Catenaria anguillulae PL171 TaxID=765915 RepID=A0A1Y2HEV8_9FUNG|nr:hypothetical protein BCR44DRAFT_49159 [Catenaria anguillulae PL171]
MGIYYHGEETDLCLFESGAYTYTHRPDPSFLCRQCQSVLDTPYKKRGTRPIRSLSPTAGTSGTSTPNRGLVGGSSANPLPPPTDDASLLLPEPTSSPVCHTCWLRIPSTLRPTWIPDELLVHHLNQLTVLCTNHESGCESIVTRGNLPVHLSTECAFEQVACVYAKFGCDVQIQRRERRGHEQMCPMASKPELALPIVLREVERVSAMADEGRRREKVMDSWMEEVDEALRELMGADADGGNDQVFNVSLGGAGVPGTATCRMLGLPTDPDTAHEVADLYHARMFERTLTVPLREPAGGNGSGSSTTSVGQTGFAFIDLRRESIDIGSLDLAMAGVLDLLESITLNRCVSKLILRLSTSADAPALAWRALARALAINSKLASLTLIIPATAVAHATMLAEAVKANPKSALVELVLLVECGAADQMTKLVDSIRAKGMPSKCTVTCKAAGMAALVGKVSGVYGSGPVVSPGSMGERMGAGQQQQVPKVELAKLRV